MELNKKFTDIISFINHQLNIDIASLCEKSNKPNTFMIVDLDKLKSHELAPVKSLGATTKKYRFEPCGGLGYAMYLSA
jgi:hypothetical protein